MAKTTYPELMQDDRIAFVVSILNSAYASNGLDRFCIQKPSADRYYPPMTI